MSYTVEEIIKYVPCETCSVAKGEPCVYEDVCLSRAVAYEKRLHTPMFKVKD